LIFIVLLREREQTQETVEDGMKGIVKCRVLCNHPFADEPLQRGGIFSIPEPRIWLIRNDYLENLRCTESLGEGRIITQVSLG
jgi:hypothetical protein